MKRKLRFYFWIGFFTFVAPLLILFYAYHKLWPLVEKMAAPILSLLPVKSSLGAFIELIIFIALILFITILLGWIAQKTVLKSWTKKVEHMFSYLFPFYSFYKNYISNTGVNNDVKWKPVLINNGVGSQMAFLVDEKDKMCTIYIPNISTPYEGTVMLIENTQIEYLDFTFNEAIDIIRNYGVGLKRGEQIK